MPWSSRLGKSNAPHRKFFLLKKSTSICVCSRLVLSSTPHSLRVTVHILFTNCGDGCTRNQKRRVDQLWNCALTNTFHHNLFGSDTKEICSYCQEVTKPNDELKMEINEFSRINWLTKSVAQKELAMSFEPSWRNGQTIRFNIRFTSCSGCSGGWMAWGGTPSHGSHQSNLDDVRFGAVCCGLFLPCRHNDEEHTTSGRADWLFHVNPPCGEDAHGSWNPS